MRSSEIHDICRRMKADGFKADKIATILQVSTRSVWRWCSKMQVALPKRSEILGRKPKINPEVRAELCNWVCANSTATQSEIAIHVFDTYGITINQATVCRMLARAGITRKRTVKHFSEQDTAKVREFINTLPHDAVTSWLALDECSFVLNHIQSYGYGRRGDRVVLSRPGIRGQRFSLLTCISPTQVVSSTLVPGGIRAPVFREFLANLPMGKHIVMDNATIHHCVAKNVLEKLKLPTVAETANDRKQILQYLPPYSPQLNPAELCFNCLRTYVNHVRPRSAFDVQKTIECGLRSMTPSMLHGFFVHCWSNKN
jgi:transposase